MNPGQASDLADDHYDDHKSAEDNPAITKQPAEIQLHRSKSCGEGRTNAPPDELTRRLPKPNAEDVEPCDRGFKCGLLLYSLFARVFGQRKEGRARKQEAEVIEEVISRTVSLERFECGSWASSAICRSSDEGGDSKHHFFDLPMELIRTGVTDYANSPVTAAFVFDKDRKGILKKSRSTKSEEKAGRHVRFSTSCPDSPVSCVSPRLLKAREDFVTFLEARE